MEALTISRSVPTANEVDSAILGCTSFLQSDAGSSIGSIRLFSSVDGLGMLQSVEEMTFGKAFELMHIVEPIQVLVKSMVTNPEMWAVFINSDAVKNFRQQLQTGASDGESDRSLNARSPQLNITAQQESLQPGLWEKILLEFIKIGKTIFMAFKLLFQGYGGGGGGGGGGGHGGGGGRGRGRGRGAGGGEQTSDGYLEVAFLLSIVLMLGIQLIRFFVMGW